MILGNIINIYVKYSHCGPLLFNVELVLSCIMYAKEHHIWTCFELGISLHLGDACKCAILHTKINVIRTRNLTPFHDLQACMNKCHTK